MLYRPALRDSPRYTGGDGPADRPYQIRLRHTKWLLMLALLACAGVSVSETQAAVLWSDFGTTLAHNTGEGYDILNGGGKEDDSSTNTICFKFRVDRLSDA